MKEIERKATLDLIAVLELYLAEGLSEPVKEKAKAVYDTYHPGSALLSEFVMEAVGRLFPIAYSKANSGIKPLTKKQAEKLLGLLKKAAEEMP